MRENSQQYGSVFPVFIFSKIAKLKIGIPK
jgi:hypothetical protein